MNQFSQKSLLHLSVVIISYQRCESLIRLLTSLNDSIADSKDIDVNDMEIIVILDGSTDGSEIALANFQMQCTLRYCQQKNRGRAAARNAGAAQAKGSFFWFLDDDMTVNMEALTAHSRFHTINTESRVLVGPQWEQEVSDPSAEYFTTRIERLADAETINNAFDFWSGNFSVSSQAFKAVGGFDEGFVGWGAEDVELGFRLLKHNVPILFKLNAGGYHWRPRTSSNQIREQREEGRNLVRLCRLHSEALKREYISDDLIKSLFFYCRSAWTYKAIARTAETLLHFSLLEKILFRFKLFETAMSSARLAGILYAAPSEQLIHDLVYGGTTMISDKVDATKPLSDIRHEYETDGILKSCRTLANKDAMSDVIADAPLFYEAVTELKSGEKNRVPYIFTPSIAKVACDEALISTVQDILGTDEWVVWGANIQLGTPNSAHSWHRDIESIFWPCITVAIGLCGCAEKNATLYIPGSHLNTRGPDLADDQTNTELVLQAAIKSNPVCNRIERFSGFSDGNYFVFNARGWHCGDIEASTDRLVLFLHYQRADDPRIPYMRDHTANSWFKNAAAFMPNPTLGDKYEHCVYLAPEYWN